jgi:hypothetical protein
MTMRTAAKEPSDDDVLDLIAEAQNDSAFDRKHD